jgi:exosortase family protein XrtM
MNAPKPIRFLLSPTLPAFVVRIVLLIIGLTGLTQTELFKSVVESPLIDVNTKLTHHTLVALGSDVTISGTFVYSEGVTLEIVEACTGIFVFLLLFSATLAFPARWKTRGLGIFFGATMIFVLNWIRIVTLFFILRDYPDLFDDFHVYVWQGTIIVCVTLYWYTWALRFAARELPTEA